MPTRPRVLLIGWDAADWRMIEPLARQGLMPNFARFISEGVSGNIASLTPMISPILWTSIATGKWGDKHGILGFAEPDGTTGKTRPVTSTSRSCEALWTILHRHGFKASVVNWFASHPAEEAGGVIITDRFAPPVGRPDQEWPVMPGTISPAALAEKAAKLRVHPARTTFDQVQRFVPALQEIEAEAALAAQAHAADALEKAPGAVPPVPVSPDRARVNELRSLLAQCATVHSAATWILKEHSTDFLGVYYDAIDRFAHAFMEFHPPRMPHVPEKSFERFRNVMTMCYQFHDMMLGRLLQLAGPDTLVFIVSDHGFYSDDLRPEGTSAIKGGKPVAWHRPFGVFAARGPGIKKGEKVFGASLLDVTPTILAAMALPVGQDMDGQVLTQIFETPPDVKRIPTHEVPDRPKIANTDEDPWVVQQMLDQLVQLGYLSENSTEEIVVDRLRNLAQIYLATGRPKLALAEYEKALEKKPGDETSKLGIARCRAAFGQTEEAERLIREVLGADSESTRGHIHLGTLAMRRDDPAAALEHFRKAAEIDPKAAGVRTNAGQALVRLQRWAEAAEMFEAAIAANADDADAWDGLGVAYRAMKQPADAVFAHMRAVSLVHARPRSHVNLALALGEVGKTRWAAEALKVAAGLDPTDPAPHELLAQLHERAFKEPEKAAELRARAKELRRAQAAGTSTPSPRKPSRTCTSRQSYPK